MQIRIGFVLLLSLAISTGCAHHPVNSALVDDGSKLGFTEALITSSEKSDELFVVLTFSGGGARAAALSYGVLEELAATPIPSANQEQTLFNEIDLISAVSGGSFTAAYFGLFGEKIFTDFEPLYLKKNVKAAIEARMLSPINWFRLASPFFHRSDLAAEYYDKHLFDGGTFGDIAARGTPIIINATNMTQGTRFGFDTEQFSWICSDLMQFPVSRAVAASSAVPIALSPITLNNYAGSCNYQPPKRLSDSLKTQQLSSREYQQAASIASYLDAEQQPYIHLYDGGLSDNLGLRAVIDAVTLAGGAAQTFTNTKSLAQTQKVLFIVVNAQTALDHSWAKRARGPSSLAVLYSAVRVPLSRYNFETIALLRSSFKGWEEQIAKTRCIQTDQAPVEACKPMHFYLAEVSFDGLNDEDEQAYLKTLPTTVTLPGDDIDRLKGAARRLLRESQEFQTFLKDINAN